MPFCRSAPVSPGTWTASSRCAPPPTGGRERSSLPIGPASPSPMRRMCGQYWKAATVPWPVGLSYPLSKHRFWVPSGRATTMLSRVGLKSFVSWTLAPATATLRGPPAASTRMLFLLPALPRSVGLRPMAPPKTGLAHGAVRRLPFPVHSAQFFTALHQNSPDALQHSKLHPALEGPVDSAVVSQFPGQTVPLAATAHPEDDAVQHPPGVGAFAPRTLGRVLSKITGVNLLPEMVGNLPNRRQSFVLSHRPPPHFSLS